MCPGSQTGRPTPPYPTASPAPRRNSLRGAPSQEKGVLVMHRPTGRLSRRSAVACAALMAALVAAAPAGASSSGYRQTNLVSDQPGHARVIDRHLVNAWGLATARARRCGWPTTAPARRRSTPARSTARRRRSCRWSSTRRRRRPDRSGVQRDRRLPGRRERNAHGEQVHLRLRDRQDHGLGAGYHPCGRRRRLAGAIYKGLAMASVPGRGALLYAADFHNNRIDVFNSSFAHPTTAGLPRPASAGRVRAVQHPEHRRLAVRLLREAGRRRRGRDRRSRPGRGGRLHAVRAPRPAAGHRRRAERPVGPGPRTQHASAGSAATSWWATSVTGASTRSTPTRPPAGHAALGHGAAVAIDGLWGLRFGNSAFGGREPGVQRRPRRRGARAARPDPHRRLSALGERGVPVVTPGPRVRSARLDGELDLDQRLPAGDRRRPRRCR